MGRVKVSALLDLFERMASEHWAYEWGAAREGCVDCSGAFVYAYKALGDLSIAHGSNTIARKHCGALVPASEAKPGYAMFRWREEGEPERYEKDGLDDFYHIGLMSRTGTVLNAKSTASGFVESPMAGWPYAAPLLAVDYVEEGDDVAQDTVLYSAVVCTKDDPLTLRDSPNGTKIGKLPKGCTVDVLDDSQNGWWRVRLGALVGYASAAYLQRGFPDAQEAESVEIADGVTAEGIESTTLLREDAQGCITLIGHWRVAED